MIRLCLNAVSVALLLFCASLPGKSQVGLAKYPPLRINLSDDGRHYLRFTFLNQVWIRYTDANPGTLVNGFAQDEIFDIGLRRTRIQFFGKLSPRVYFYTQMGINNFLSFLPTIFSAAKTNKKQEVFLNLLCSIFLISIQTFSWSAMANPSCCVRSSGFCG